MNSARSHITYNPKIAMSKDELIKKVMPVVDFFKCNLEDHLWAVAIEQGSKGQKRFHLHIVYAHYSTYKGIKNWNKIMYMLHNTKNLSEQAFMSHYTKHFFDIEFSKPQWVFKSHTKGPLESSIGYVLKDINKEDHWCAYHESIIPQECIDIYNEGLSAGLQTYQKHKIIEEHFDEITIKIFESQTEKNSIDAKNEAFWRTIKHFQLNDTPVKNHELKMWIYFTRERLKSLLK